MYLHICPRPEVFMYLDICPRPDLIFIDFIDFCMICSRACAADEASYSAKESCACFSNACPDMLSTPGFQLHVLNLQVGSGY